MKIISVKYYSEEMPEGTYEDFINHLFLDLKKFEKVNPDFKFKVNITHDFIEVKTVKMNECKN